MIMLHTSLMFLYMLFLAYLESLLTSALLCLFVCMFEALLLCLKLLTVGVDDAVV